VISDHPAPASSAAPDAPLKQDFSLVLGGPLFQLLRRARLSDDALTLVRKRVIAITLFTWLPLLVISAAQGRALDRSGPVPFLLDIELHIRFLISVPLLVLAEIVVHQRMRTLLQQFSERRLVPESERPRFDAAIQAAFRLRNSVLAEVLLVAFVYIVGVEVIFKNYTVFNAATWYASPTPDGPRLSAAGVWYVYASLPVFQFLLCRWYFRLFIWGRFLWHVSKIELHLVPTHPDRLGGPGFLAATVNAFAPLAAAHGAVVAGQLASRIFHGGAKLTDFKAQAFALVATMVCVVFGPLLVFSPQLAAARRKGLREYGALAQRYVREFENKWLRGGAAPGEELVGSGDIQSLTDLDGSFEVVRGMRIALWTKEAILQLAMVTLAPMVPLALTMMPLEELVKYLFGILF
jgi:hypothetical protein